MEIDSAKNLIDDVIKWGRDRDLKDASMQLNKCLEELGEVAHEITRNRLGSDELKDGIGDTLVTVIILADILGISPLDALASAYFEIKYRKGQTVNGSFIKEDN